MNPKDVLRFDEYLWSVILGYRHHKTNDDASILANTMCKQGFPGTTRGVVRDAIQRLITRGKVSQKWDSKKMTTIALNPKRIIDEGNSFFIDSQPIPVTTLAKNVYNYFVDNRIVGRGKAVGMKWLANWFDITERDLRKIIERINFRGYKFAKGDTVFRHKIKGDVSGTSGGYYIVEDVEEQRAMILQYKQKIYKASRKTKILIEDFNLDDQIGAVITSTEEALREDIEQEFIRVKTLGDELVVKALPIIEEEEQDPFDVAYEKMLKDDLKLTETKSSSKIENG